MKDLAISVFSAQNLLGEGPLWSAEEQALYWIDIERPSIHKWTPTNKEYKQWELPLEPGCFAFREHGGIILALRNGIAFFEFENQQWDYIVDPEAHLPTNRFNDGKCDPRGRFWAGTLPDGEQEPLGALYRIDPNGTYQLMRKGVTVSNGIGWSPDHQKMYFTDSATRCIYVYDFEIESGNISNERIFAQDQDCYPDGLTVDAEGYIWSAKWDGWKVVRYAPNGKIDRVIKIPVQRPTSCTFGGPELTQLFITSARSRLSESALAAQPHAGDIFMLETDTQGIIEPLFKG